MTASHISTLLRSGSAREYSVLNFPPYSWASTDSLEPSLLLYCPPTCRPLVETIGWLFGHQLRQSWGRSQLGTLTVLTRLPAMRCVYVHVCVCEEGMVGGTVVGGVSGSVGGGGRVGGTVVEEVSNRGTVHAQTHAHIPCNRHTHTHTHQTHALTQTHTCTCTHTCTNHTYMYIQSMHIQTAHTHTHTHMYTPTHTHTHTHMHTHTHTHMYTPTHTHIHIHFLSP